MIDYSIIGKRVKLRRKAVHKTQDNLAEALGVTVGYISQVERGVTKVSLDTLARIATVLQCDIAELVSGVTPEHGSYLSEELGGIYRSMNDQERSLLLQIAEIIRAHREEP